MDRFVIRKPKTKSEPEKWFAGNKVNYKDNKAIVTEDVLYAGKQENAYIFTKKANANKVKESLKSKSTWKVELFKKVGK